MKLRKEDEPFIVAEITKADLQQAGIEQTIIDALTEAEMQDIADTMGDLYLDNGYWDDMREAVNRLLEAKRAVEKGLTDGKSSSQDEQTEDQKPSR